MVSSDAEDRAQGFRGEFEFVLMNWACVVLQSISRMPPCLPRSSHTC